MEYVNCGYVWGNKGTEKFCCIQCREDYEEKNKKFEEIKQKAWELFLDSPQEDGWTFSDCWRVAEDFCKFANLKQENEDV